MKQKTKFWLYWIFSVLVTSSLPMLIRVIMFYGGRYKDVLYPYTSVDIISLALILLLVISYQINSSPIYNKDDKRFFMVISLLLVVLIAVFYTQTLSDENNKKWLIPNILVVTGCLIYSLYHVNLIASKRR